MGNKGYEREKFIAKKLGLRPVPFSGSRFELGREDAESDIVLAQVKSSKERMTIRASDVWLLYCRAMRDRKIPVIVFDGLKDEVHPEQTWIAFPQEFLKDVYNLRLFVSQEDENETKL